MKKITDKMRLDWLQKYKGEMFWWPQGGNKYKFSFSRQLSHPAYRSIRQAIDAAIKKSEERENG